MLATQLEITRVGCAKLSRHQTWFCRDENSLYGVRFLSGRAINRIEIESNDGFAKHLDRTRNHVSVNISSLILAESRFSAITREKLVADLQLETREKRVRNLQHNLADILRHSFDKIEGNDDFLWPILNISQII